MAQPEKLMRVVDGRGASHIMPDNAKNRRNIETMNQFAKRREDRLEIYPYDPNNPDAPVSKTRGATATIEALANKNSQLEAANAELLKRLEALEAKSGAGKPSKEKGGTK